MGNHDRPDTLADQLGPRKSRRLSGAVERLVLVVGEIDGGLLHLPYVGKAARDGHRTPPRRAHRAHAVRGGASHLLQHDLVPVRVAQDGFRAQGCAAGGPWTRRHVHAVTDAEAARSGEAAPEPRRAPGRRSRCAPRVERRA
jgi:hypothetical protein